MRLSVTRHKHHLPLLAGLLRLVEDIIWRCPGHELLASTADAFWRLVDRMGRLETSQGTVERGQVGQCHNRHGPQACVGSGKARWHALQRPCPSSLQRAPMLCRAVPRCAPGGIKCQQSHKTGCLGS